MCSCVLNSIFCVVCRYNCIPVYTIYDATALLHLLYIVIKKIIIIKFKKLMSSHALEDYFFNLKQVLVRVENLQISALDIIFRTLGLKRIYDFIFDSSGNSTSHLCQSLEIF